MDPPATEAVLVQPLRRSMRQASGKAPSFEVTSRAPIKRSRRSLESRAPAGKVNGTQEAEDSSEDEGSPNKKSRTDREEAEGGRGDGAEMGSEESGEDVETNEDQPMDVGHSHSAIPQKTCQGSLRDLRFSPQVVLGERCKVTRDPHHDPSWTQSTSATHHTKAPAAPGESSLRNRSGTNKHVAPPPKIRSMEDYRHTMEHKARSAGSSSQVPAVNYRVPSVHPATQTSRKLPSHVNNVPVQKQSRLPRIKKEESESESVDRERSGSSSRGWRWGLCGVVLLLLLGSAALLPNIALPSLRSSAAGGDPRSGAARAEKLSEHLSLLEAQFPSQRPELWKRARIHLEKHLSTQHPLEPVSAILTAGRGAERTLRCIAGRLADSFSSVLNASVLHIDGAGMAGQNGDQVKMDIDNQLRAAFEGRQPVAVIHRLEELPPSSTLIFYRYCDHENAAYKKVFLLFTVLLPQDEVGSELTLKQVEELVQDYVEERLVGSSSQAAFNEMDTDKFGGLWSRISHLILPVASEERVEQRGC